MSRSRELTQKWWLQHRGQRKIRFYWPIVPYCKLLSWIWNPPPRDLLHKQKKLGKSLGRFYVIRFVFYGAELFLGFEIPTQGKIKLLKIFLAGAPGLSEWVLCSFSLVSENWKVRLEKCFFSISCILYVSWNNDILHILIENWCRQSCCHPSDPRYEQNTSTNRQCCIRLI